MVNRKCETFWWVDAENKHQSFSCSEKRMVMQAGLIKIGENEHLVCYTVVPLTCFMQRPGLQFWSASCMQCKCYGACCLPICFQERVMKLDSRRPGSSRASALVGNLYHCIRYCILLSRRTFRTMYFTVYWDKSATLSSRQGVPGDVSFSQRALSGCGVTLVFCLFQQRLERIECTVYGTTSWLFNLVFSYTAVVRSESITCTSSFKYGSSTNCQASDVITLARLMYTFCRVAKKVTARMQLSLSIWYRCWAAIIPLSTSSCIIDMQCSNQCPNSADLGST